MYTLGQTQLTTTLSPGRQGNTHVNNSQAVTHENGLLRCSHLTPGLSRNNPHDIDMKLGPETKLDKRDKTPLKIFYDDAMWKNYDVIANLWLTWSNLEAGFLTHSL